MYLSKISKTVDGMHILNVNGKCLGAFKTREQAMERFWQVDDQQKRAGERMDYDRRRAESAKIRG